MDSMFLLGESREHPMHVGGLLLLRPPAGVGPRDLRDRFAAAIGRDDTAGIGRDDTAGIGRDDTVAAVWRKRAVRSWSTLGQWAWHTDTNIDLEYHVRFNALPSPGTLDDLWVLVSRLHASLLDRSRPLWEMHLIEGLADGRYAVYVKIHHAVADGVGAMRLLRRALSADPDDRDMPAPWAVPDGSDPARSTAGAAIDLPGAVVRAARGVLSDVVGVVPTLVDTVDRALHDRGGALSLSAPATILNVPIAGSRRFVARSWSLARLRAVAAATESTVNDVVLAMSAGALRTFLDERGVLPDRPLVAMVPVALRNKQSGGGGTGNEIAVLMCSLGTNLPDSASRFDEIKRSMGDGKDAMSGMSTVSRLAASAVGVAPLAVGVLTGNRAVWRPPFNVIVSNVPGPDSPLYWNGARVDALYPLSVPVDGQALNITCTSTSDEIAFGLTACGRTVPELGCLLVHLDVELEKLEVLAGVRTGEEEPRIATES